MVHVILFICTLGSTQTVGKKKRKKRKAKEALLIEDKKKSVNFSIKMENILSLFLVLWKFTLMLTKCEYHHLCMYDAVRLEIFAEN